MAQIKVGAFIVWGIAIICIILMRFVEPEATIIYGIYVVMVALAWTAFAIWYGSQV